MAVFFNTTAQGSHIGTLCLIYRVLRRATDKEITVDKLKELCAPDTLARKSNHKTKFQDMLTFWGKDFHKIWSINEDGKLSLIPDHVTKNPNPTPEEISKVVRSALFKKPIETITTAKNDNKYTTEPLFLCLSCFLACEAHGPFDKVPINKSAIVSSLRERLGTGTDYALNEEEFSGLIEWMLFLGFANLNHGDVVIDPTRVVKDVLNEIFCLKATLPIREFINKIGHLIPVFDGGDYHKQTILLMKSNGWEYNYDKKMSSSLSLALHRLQIENLITLVPGSDDLDSIEMDEPISMQSKAIAAITFREFNTNA